ncbi:MAG TPA: hypothetical protein VMT43_12750 [Acidimicrobiales bacterium]|nr:hypothetical protein [Acidimicrobiales bacterium]
MCFIQGDLGRAEELGLQVLVEARDRGDRWGEGMMLLLASGVRCWTGRTNDALDFARQAHALFRSIGDRFGEAQALTSLGRVLASVGRVAEGLAMLHDGLEASLADRESKETATLVTGLVNVAVHLGEARLAVETFARITEAEIAGMAAGIGAGAVEREVARGLALLQSGEVSEAVAILRRESEVAPNGTPSTYALSALALALAACGEHDEVVEVEHQVATAAHVTYLDRASASMALALAMARRGEAEAAAALDDTVVSVDATEDQISQAVVRLALAAVLDSLDDPGAPAAADRAELRLRELGITADGWRTVFRLALTAAPAAV